MKIRSIRREMRLLRYYSITCTVVAGVFLLGAAYEARGNTSFDTLTVHRIDVVDREGKSAMVITDHDDFPPPIVNGKTVKRMGGNDANGIVFYNQLGNEQGALLWSANDNKRQYSSSTVLSYDSVKTDQLLQLDDGNDSGKLSAYLIGWNRPDETTASFKRFLAELQKTATVVERRKLFEKHPEYRGVIRFLVGYDETNTSQVVLADGHGRPRIKMYVTPGGQAALQFLDATGKVVAQYPGQGR